MDIFNVLELVGGLALFLFGMNVMSSSLTRMSGGKLENTLKKLTANPLKSIALGTGITIAIQSSSAMTVMLVGLVNSGVMKLSQTVAVIMGSNIGKTLTSWLLSLSGIKSSNIFVTLLKPESFAPIIAIIGVAMMMVSKKEKRRDIGNVLIGFAVLLMGMTTMSGAVSPLADAPEFAQVLTYFKNPVLGLFTGTAFTAVIQSSAASVGILQALCVTVNISYRVAIPIILGQNIGTCITAVLASIGVNKDAKRVAAVHVLFNLIGAVAFLICLFIGNAVFRFSFLDEAATPVGIAVVHTVFNILNTLVLLPFRKQLQHLAELIIPDAKNKEEKELLDERLLLNPSLAVEHTTMVATKMVKKSREVLMGALELIYGYDRERAAALWDEENDIDIYEDKIGTYLILISSKAISERDSRQVSMLLEDIVDFERISDHGANIISIAQEMEGKNIAFSEYARTELDIITGAVKEILDIVCEAFDKKDMEMAKRVEPLEQVVDDLRDQLRNRHTERLKEGICTMETGIFFLDILTNLERVSDHCSNIAVNLIRILEGSFDTHEYLDKVKADGANDYDSLYAAYSKKYRLSWITPAKRDAETELSAGKSEAMK